MKNKCKYTSIGGSALIEGVMMRGNDKTAIAVRRANGSIVLKVEDTPADKRFYTKIPIVRGVIGFITSMITSYKAIMYSADVSMEDIAKEEETEIKPWFTKLITVVAMVLGILLGVGAFIYLPTLITDLFSDYVIELSGVAKRIITGVVKMLIFLVYMLAVSGMKDMRRVFMYHGAEHKTIFCYEAGDELTPENAKKHTRFHPRCGTSFLFVMLFLSILVYSLPFITWDNMILRLATKLIMLPLIVGLGFEFIMFAGKHCDNIIVRILATPGLWMQRITTCEPDDSQLEVAICALKSAMIHEFPDFEVPGTAKKTEEAPTEDKSNTEK